MPPAKPAATSVQNIASSTSANRTPQKHAPMLSLKSNSNILAAKIPVHAPVPRTGIPTKRTNARNIPFPDRM